MHNWISRPSIFLLILLVASCSTITSSTWDRKYGKAIPREYSPQQTNSLSYYQDVKPLIESRCTVCHGCYDSPCQLKLDSFQGLLRGANPEKVYDGTRLTGIAMTRLFEDANTTAEWREKSFHPVLNERTNTPANNVATSLVAKMLLLKKQFPLPTQGNLPDTFDLNLDHKQYCTKAENFTDYANKFPYWGMPYALPGLNEKEHALMMKWIRQGALPGVPPELPENILRQLTQWENYFNRDDLKSRLVSRYIYEHLFLAQLNFDEAPNSYFRLVRSSTPPGQPIARINTRRPFDDPNTERVYYRLWYDPSSVVAKNHMPYALNKNRMSDWDKWFFQSNYSVATLPNYDPKTASNPFVTFVDLPIDARYRFMLSEAQFTIMNFIKGPVCRGQVALNVIQNNFWVFFFDPDTQSDKNNAAFLVETSKYLELPAEVGNTFFPISNWIKYSDMQKEFLAAKAKQVAELNKNKPLSLDIIWDGDKGKNKNAALTIFRHNDSASVYQGLIGEPPKTAWIIGYPLMERIHYLLVAGFDVYGNISHQLLSRLYMDFLRMEGEMNFLEFLPKETRQKEIAFWYKDAEDAQQNYLDLYLNNLNIKNSIVYKSDNPKIELYEKLKKQVGDASTSSYSVNYSIFKNESATALANLEKAPGAAVSLLPQTTLVRVPELGVFTLVHNNAYTNISSLFREDKRRLPEDDTLTLAKGIIGAFPNSFMRVNEKDLSDFSEKIIHLTSEADYETLRNIYGIRRTNPDFWKFSDELMQYYKTSEPKEAGILDYNRMENR